MSKAESVDRKQVTLSPLAQKTLEVIKSEFTPMCMSRTEDTITGTMKYSPDIIVLCKWEGVIEKADFLRPDNGNWKVECSVSSGGIYYRINRNMWDISDDMNANLPTILPPTTIRCLDNGADSAEMFINLPSPVGDYETFVNSTLTALAKMYKLSRWLKERAMIVYGEDQEWADKTLMTLLENS